jgi:hypothetical protein
MIIGAAAGFVGVGIFLDGGFGLRCNVVTIDRNPALRHGLITVT